MAETRQIKKTFSESSKQKQTEEMKTTRMNEKYAIARKNFSRNFRKELDSTLSNTQIIIVSLGTGQSDEKENNKKAIKELIRDAIKEDMKSKVEDSTLLCLKKNLDVIQTDRFGDERRKRLKRVIFNFLDSPDRYKSLIKSPEPILKYTNQIIIFVRRKIPKYLKYISPAVTFKHFVIKWKCKLFEIEAPINTGDVPKKVLKRKKGDDGVAGNWEVCDTGSSETKRIQIIEK